MPAVLGGLSGLACHSPSETLSQDMTFMTSRQGNKSDSDPTISCTSLTVLRSVALAVHHAVASPMLHPCGARVDVTGRNDVGVVLAQ
eukprot:898188-Heterocapsa_arctica.AAC.1